MNINIFYWRQTRVNIVSNNNTLIYFNLWLSLFIIDSLNLIFLICFIFVFIPSNSYANNDDKNYHRICNTSEEPSGTPPEGCMKANDFIQNRCDGKHPCFSVGNDGWDTDLVGFGNGERSREDTPFVFATLEYRSDTNDNTSHKWQHEQLDAIIDAIKNKNSDNKRTLLYVFVHGWHHDAHEIPSIECSDDDNKNNKCTQDGNLSYFKYLLAKSRHELNRRGEKERRIIGVYIGWNGGPPDALFNVGSRARAADRIGRSDDFTNDLNTLSKELFSADSSNRMLIVCHSFGGRMVLRNILEKKPDWLDKNSLVAAINPAIGADAFDDTMMQPSRQGVPPLIIITNENDNATNGIFSTAASIGRVLGFGWGITNKVFTSSAYSAIGHYEPYQTHRLNIEYEGSKPCSNYEGRNTGWYKIDADGKYTAHTICYDDGEGNHKTYEKYTSTLTGGEGFHNPPGSLWNIVTDNNTLYGDKEHQAAFIAHNAFVQTNLNRMLIELLFSR